MVAYAKSIDVNTLDSFLPSQRLEDWLQSAPLQADFHNWRVEDTCQLKPDYSDQDYLLCVSIRVGRHKGQRGVFLIQVGTFQKGIVGPPQVNGGVTVFEGGFILTGGSDRLSELPALLAQPVVTEGVESLYQKIVTLHPLGIPVGTQMAHLQRYLSKRLIEQLQTARACQDDYFRQRHRARGTSKPGWLKSGLFSGNGGDSAPVYAGVTHKERQADGSFLVSVTLQPVEAVISRRKGPPSAFYGGYSWHVEARVILENGSFVVDDVRIVDSPAPGEPAYLLSNSFAGCDGSRWVGITATSK